MFPVEVHPGKHLFQESTYATHKAIRVFCLAASQAACSSVTWSISTAYQAAVLAVRALLGFCGVAYVGQNPGFLVDVFPGAPKGQRGSNVPAHGATGYIQIIPIGRLENRDWWSIFKRVLRSSKFSCWRYGIDDQLQRLDAKRWGSHRNELHYGLAWFFDDLLSSNPIDGFGEYSDVKTRAHLAEGLGDPGGSDSSILLAEVLLGNTLAMLADLAQGAPIVRTEYETMLNTITENGNDIVRKWIGVLESGFHEVALGNPSGLRQSMVVARR